MTENGQRTFSVTRAVSTLGAAFVLMGSVFLFPDSHQNFWAFIDLRTLFVVAGLPFFLLLGIHGKRFIAFLPEAMKTFFYDPLERDPDFAEIAMDGERLSMAAGMIGVVLGLVLLLGNLADPSTIGPSMAWSLLSLGYGLVLSECLFGVVAKAYQATPGPSNRSPKSGIFLAFGGIFAIVCCFFVMFFAFSGGSEPPKAAPQPEVSFEELAIETNLGEITEGHTIKFKACLKVSDPQTKALLQSATPFLREKIIRILLKKSFQDMSGPASFETLKGEVASVISDLVKENNGKETPSVSFSEFLVK